MKLDNLTATEKKLITDAYQKDGEGWISKQNVDTLLKKISVDINTLMLALLPIARDKARMPVCDYHVGSIALGISGNLYFGACQDYGYGPINQTVHAEQAAVSNAFSHNEIGIIKLACTDAPCGHCRQFLYELNTAQTLEIILPDRKPVLLTELLPGAFGPKELGQEATLLNKASHSIELKNKSDIIPLVESALDTAKASYALYTNAYSGVAIKTHGGKIYVGKYIENVAHNPSLPPMQAALVHLILSGEEYKDIESAVLVQCQNNLINQSASSLMTLNAVAPDVELLVFETKTIV